LKADDGDDDDDDGDNSGDVSEGNMFLCLLKHHTVKIYGGVNVITPRILNFCTGGRLVIFILRPL
jgi:hypothetical protein